MNRFFRNSQLKSLHRFASFTFDANWLKQLNRISWEISNDNWKSQKIQIEINIANIFTTKIYHIRWRLLNKILRFWFDHSIFDKHLHYASIQQFIINKNRFYNEYHIVNHWWDKQSRYSKDATLTFFFISTNKIELFRQQENHFVWTCYITLSNISRKMRRNQTRFAQILLNNISIVHFEDENSDHLNMKVYHIALNMMFERMWRFLRNFIRLK